MQTEISSGPAFAFGEIKLAPGSSVRVEAGAMAMTRGDVAMTTSTRGGFLKGLRRSLGGESFFVNDFTSQEGGLVAVAAPLPGDMTQIPLTGGTLLVQSGSWVASDPTVEVGLGRQQVVLQRGGPPAGALQRAWRPPDRQLRRDPRLHPK